MNLQWTQNEALQVTSKDIEFGQYLPTDDVTNRKQVRHSQSIIRATVQACGVNWPETSAVPV